MGILIAALCLTFAAYLGATDMRAELKAAA
jgi:hypothetical protein